MMVCESMNEAKILFKIWSDWLTTLHIKLKNIINDNFESLKDN